jgi:hypothetical protein
MRQAFSVDVARDRDETGKPMSVARYLTRIVKGRLDGTLLPVNLTGRDQYEALLARVAEDVDDAGRPLTLERFFVLVVDAYLDGRLRIERPPPERVASFIDT